MPALNEASVAYPVLAKMPNPDCFNDNDALKLALPSSVIVFPIKELVKVFCPVIVSVAGTTNLDGITDWFVGDWAIFNGGVWQHPDL